MAREPTNYGILRTELAAQLPVQDEQPEHAPVQQPVEIEHGTRAGQVADSETVGPVQADTGNGKSPGWTNEGGMVQHNTSANAWFAEGSRRFAAQADTRAETAAESEPLASKGEGEAPEMSDARRAMIEQAEARTPPERPPAPGESQTKSTGMSR